MRKRWWLPAAGACAAIAAVVTVLVLVLPSGDATSPGLAAPTTASVGSLAVASAPPLATSTADETAAVSGSTQFALDLARTLENAPSGGGSGNVVIAPSTVSTLLSMLLPGARGTTDSEIANVLHTSLSPQALAAATGALDAEMTGQAAADHVQLSMSSAVWTQIDYQLQAAYLRTLAGGFDTGVHQADFERNADQATQEINALVSQQTHGLVPQVLPQGSLDQFTRLVLTDAVYLKAQWARPFDPSNTSPGPFRLTGGGTADVSMMDQEGTFPYADTGGWQAVELPYQGGDLAMDLLIPNQPTSGPVLSALDPSRLDALVGGLSPTDIDVAVPKFTFDESADLSQPLKALGMPTAFGPSADFSGVAADPSDRLSLSGVYEDAHIAVDENGTTAAGAAAGGMAGAVARAQQPQQVRFDHPFAFVIRDVHTGQILFLGQVANPTQGTGG